MNFLGDTIQPRALWKQGPRPNSSPAFGRQGGIPFPEMCPTRGSRTPAVWGWPWEGAGHTQDPSQGHLGTSSFCLPLPSPLPPPSVLICWNLSYALALPQRPWPLTLKNPTFWNSQTFSELYCFCHEFQKCTLILKSWELPSLFFGSLPSGFLPLRHKTGMSLLPELWRNHRAQRDW